MSRKCPRCGGEVQRGLVKYCADCLQEGLDDIRAEESESDEEDDTEESEDIPWYSEDDDDDNGEDANGEDDE